MQVKATWWGLTLAGSLALSQHALAQSDQDRAAARKFGEEGQAALESRDYKTAEDYFGRAVKLFSAPTLSLGLARAYAGQGKYVLAQETYNRIVREGAGPTAPTAFRQAVADATKEIESVSAKIAQVTIQVKGGAGEALSGLQVFLDDKPINTVTLGVKTPVDPGTHTLKATAEGHKSAETTFAVGEAGTTTATLQLDREQATSEPPPPPTAVTPSRSSSPSPPSGTLSREVPKHASSNTLAYAAFGVGGAGLVVGAVFGAMTLGKKSDLDKTCPGGTCPSDQQSAVDSYKTSGLISTIGFATFGVGAAAGAVLLFTAPKDSSHATWTPLIGLGTLGATGRF